MKNDTAYLACTTHKDSGGKQIHLGSFKRKKILEWIREFNDADGIYSGRIAFMEEVSFQ